MLVHFVGKQVLGLIWVLIIYCCVKDTPKLSGLKQPFIYYSTQFWGMITGSAVRCFLEVLSLVAVRWWIRLDLSESYSRTSGPWAGVAGKQLWASLQHDSLQVLQLPEASMAAGFSQSTCSKRPRWQLQDFLGPSLGSYTVSFHSILLAKKQVPGSAGIWEHEYQSIAALRSRRTLGFKHQY